MEWNGMERKDEAETAFVASLFIHAACLPRASRKKKEGPQPAGALPFLPDWPLIPDSPLAFRTNAGATATWHGPRPNERCVACDTAPVRLLCNPFFSA